MPLFSSAGHRSYLTAKEWADFLKAADHGDAAIRMFFRVLHYSGHRPSEVLKLIPERVLVDQKALMFRSLTFTGIVLPILKMELGRTSSANIMHRL